MHRKRDDARPATSRTSETDSDAVTKSPAKTAPKSSTQVSKTAEKAPAKAAKAKAEPKKTEAKKTEAKKAETKTPSPKKAGGVDEGEDQEQHGVHGIARLDDHEGRRHQNGGEEVEEETGEHLPLCPVRCEGALVEDSGEPCARLS